MSTGLDRIDISLDELNFCLEYDKPSPLLDVGFVKKALRYRNNPDNAERKTNSVRENPSPLTASTPTMRPKPRDYRPRFDNSRFPSSPTNEFQQSRFKNK